MILDCSIQDKVTLLNVFLNAFQLQLMRESRRSFTKLNLSKKAKASAKSQQKYSVLSMEDYEDSDGSEDHAIS